MTIEDEPKPVSYAERNQKIKNILSDLSRLASFEDLVKSQEEIKSFYDRLKVKYPDFNSHRILHVLIGSMGPSNSKITEDDFPGDDSVENFVNDLARKYINK